jgi:hypothetical protein
MIVQPIAPAAIEQEPESPPVQKPVPPPAEIGGRDGPDPIRFGDWEKNGRCIDF